MHRKSDDKIVKGYYYTEKDIVQKIRDSVLQSPEDKKFKTIECQIMDIADDISYSTYDLEDAFKAEFLSPIGILASEPEFINRVSIEVQRALMILQSMLKKCLKF